MWQSVSCCPLTVQPLHTLSNALPPRAPGHPAFADYRACKYEVTASRAGLAAAARSVVGKKITYISPSTYNPARWTFNTGGRWVCPAKVPPSADCSSFVSWIYWTAFGMGPDHLNGASWKGGATGTMADRGTRVSATTYNSRGGVVSYASTANARPGDLVFYGRYPHTHVAIYIGNDQVVNYGSNNPVSIQGVRHRSDLEQIRSYPAFGL